jgi:nucleoside-diphosphate-sugar epimerase
MNRTIAQPFVLVTGATGFLGKAIVRNLAAKNCKVRTTARRNNPAHGLPNFHQADLSETAALAGLLNKVDVVIHTAGLTHDPAVSTSTDEDFFRNNTDVTTSLVNAAAKAGCRRFIYVSSISVYGVQCSPVTEQASCNPITAYARSKLAAERRIVRVANETGIETNILRMAPICGEGARGNLLRLMKAIDRRRFVWVGKGVNLKSLIHVDDAACACVTAACCDGMSNSGVYNVSSPACPMQEIVSAIATALGRTIPRIRLSEHFPLQVIHGAASLPVIRPVAERALLTLDKWLRDEDFDSSLFRHSFAWNSRIGIREALSRQVNYYRNSAVRCA